MTALTKTTYARRRQLASSTTGVLTNDCTARYRSSPYMDAPTGHSLPAHRMLFSLLYSRNLYRLRLPATVPSASSGPSLAPPYARPNHRPRCAACSSEASICTVAMTGIRAADASLPKQPFPENYVSHRMPYSLTSVCQVGLVRLVWSRQRGFDADNRPRLPADAELLELSRRLHA